ncbi:SIR2 family protein [Phenylobacterium sp. NIBR 498073]|uniref:SIR2 family protein n=1 Tax=Phenylobacterium sp. NIBR 498073 TaxID=3015177 RepID=UPI0022B2B455|nr:SIR2 family protein [Phenylobacterium sp. NIBR 498073]WGU41421.1 SIR2 family protein [Phenylobacterium sp. NIBR 498073]
MKRDAERFIVDFLKEIEAGNAAIFAGAGLSAPAGFVDWRGLLRELAEEIDLNIDLETDLVSVAQFHVNHSGSNRNRLNQAIIEALAADNPPTLNHRVLARLPIATWWTTNYDQLIERALREVGKVVDVKADVPQLANTRPRRDAIVYKMHGDVERPHEAVVTRDDYERYERDRGAFTSALAGDLVSKTFLFLGFSFSDPNLDQVLARVRLNFRENQRRHYAIFKRRARQADDTDETFAHAQARQLLVVQDLKRFHIEVLLVDEYQEIDVILAEIERRYRRTTVFVSTSADDFAPWGEREVEAFMRDLGAVLVDNGLRISTGLGLGVGNPLFTGAVERVLTGQGRHIEDIITARPFPQAIPNEAERRQVWEAFRQDLIGRAGLALFLFGNKRDGDNIMAADGMVREYEVACELDLVVLPVGATGSVAARLAAQALATPDEHLAELNREAREILKALAEPVEHLADLLDPIVRLLVSLRRST